MSTFQTARLRFRVQLILLLSAVSLLCSSPHAPLSPGPHRGLLPPLPRSAENGQIAELGMSFSVNIAAREFPDSSRHTPRQRGPRKALYRIPLIWIFSSIFANEFTYSTVQIRAPPKGSKSRPHRILVFKTPQSSKHRKKKRVLVKKLIFEESYYYADTKPLPQTLFEGCQNGSLCREFHFKECEKTKPCT